MVEKIRVVFERYGFEPLETPAIEYTDALGKFLPDQDRPNEGVFSFQDDDEQWLSLRYDLTAPLARYVAENYQQLALPHRSYRYGWVFRNEKPGPGRFRQFMQFDADTVGAPTMAADAEMCMLAADTMEALGIKRGDYVVKVNNRKVLDGLLESIDIVGDLSADKHLNVMRAVDKLDRLGPDAVFLLLTSGRKDESGDFTKGADLSGAQADNVMRFLGYSASVTSGHRQYKRDTIEHPAFKKDEAIKWFEDRVQLGPTGLQGLDELKAIANLIHSAGYDDGRVLIDPSVVRGLEYYTGPVYEVELTFEIDDDKGRPIRFGSVGGGGRYDGLVSRFMGQPVPATGFSIGVSRLQAALAALGKPAGEHEAAPVLVTVFDHDRVADYQRMVQDLRNAKLRPDDPNSPYIRAELYLGNPKNIGNQLRYAERRGAPCVVIQGGDEKAKRKILIKDMVRGAALKQISDHKEYLRQQTNAQTLVKAEYLVRTVRNILKRQMDEVSNSKRPAKKKHGKKRAKVNTAVRSNRAATRRIPSPKKRKKTKR
jgi:histidyl-tRNA synthetase